MAKVKYFSGAIEVQRIQGITNAQFQQLGGVKSKHNWYDGFKRLAGIDKEGNLLPVTRTIFYQSNPSLHKCNSRCQSAKGHNCECECGGENHGIAA